MGRFSTAVPRREGQPLGDSIVKKAFWRLLSTMRSIRRPSQSRSSEIALRKWRRFHPCAPS